MKLRNFLLIAFAAMNMSVQAQATVAHFDMTLNNGTISESVSNTDYIVNSQLPACTIAGIDGEALRFDGYSNYVRAGLPVSSLSVEALTVSVTLAAESYPMMKIDAAEDIPTYATICGNLDEANKKGFAFELSSQGDLRVRLYVDYSGGYAVIVDGSKKLQRGQWNMLTMTFDKADNAINLYLNGEQIGSKKSNRCALIHSTTDFMIGKDATSSKFGPFFINTFCGAIDDIAIYNEVIAPAAFAQQTAIFNYSSERYCENLWRPQFHGMPSGSWTNETHGMIYSGGRYHVFFQKNANGPYMSRLHWGHISSENLYDWTEEPIAIYPGESYDIKGCWSGCVYEDDGDTYILYTAVDNAKARIAQAKAKDAGLLEWEKQGVIIDGRPSGLSDDFRDPYFFMANGQKYIIVGTSKNNIGACTLHKYENGAWTNTGDIFFQGSSKAEHGRFWEMPNVTDLGNGKFLFTCTPLETGAGVRTLCWIGTIGADGKFTPDESGMQLLEMGGISREGYGLLSPSICQSNGKTLLLGIVPDKLATEENYRMGWAHNYSLPREISLAADGVLIQKPYSGMAGMRSETTFVKQSSMLNGLCSLSPVIGRQIEMLGEFIVSSGSCGFHFLKSGSKQASLSYDSANGKLILDLSSLDRTVNDGVYNGIYSVTLPKKVNVGEKLKLHVYLDGSIVDVFVNDTWAYSVRIFPNDVAQVEAEAFTTNEMQVSIQAWTLDANRSGDTGIGHVFMPSRADDAIYDLQGRHLDTLPDRGVYILNGRKVIR